MGLKELKPEIIEAYFNFSKALDKGTSLTQREKELIALAVSHALQCNFCIEDHVRKARIAGAKEEEIAEAILVTAKVRAGATLTYAQHYAFPKKEEAPKE
ncbi:carboxymuconolactone decarboxylase family protein [Candidatus Micrarchaeota archaeon]|nr:carboxymuconolactone decarboxylase family protein [Candidatus Micrarchaeota archaeon]